jgi:hypothetical protein
MNFFQGENNVNTPLHVRTYDRYEMEGLQQQAKRRARKTFTSTMPIDARIV